MIEKYQESVRKLKLPNQHIVPIDNMSRKILIEELNSRIYYYSKPTKYYSIRLLLDLEKELRTKIYLWMDMSKYLTLTLLKIRWLRRTMLLLIS